MSQRSRHAQAQTDPVRDAAVRVLVRVERDGAYANMLLDRATAEMQTRDAAFCMALTLGTLRRRAQLDWALNRWLRRPIETAHPYIRQILRLGAFQILHMDVRKAAAVDEAVTLAKAHASADAAKMVNAVLRRVDPVETFRTLFGLSLKNKENWSAVTGLPGWFISEIERVWPGEAAVSACLASLNEPPLTVRVNPAKGNTAGCVEALHDAGIGATPHAFVPMLLTVHCPAPVLVGSAPFRDGLCHVQDGSAVLAALALDVQPGDQVVDLCAAPGGKAAILAAQAGASGHVFAVEKDPRRASHITDLFEREGLDNITLLVRNAIDHIAALEPGTFDRVLVDAPCSALGVARHRPDLLWRPPPDVAHDMVPTQRQLLAAGLRLLRPGGVLVYSVCTFTPEEGEGVVQPALETDPDVHADPLPPLLHRWTRATERAIIPPGDAGLDGFTIIRLRRRS